MREDSTFSSTIVFMMDNPLSDETESLSEEDTETESDSDVLDTSRYCSDTTMTSLMKCIYLAELIQLSLN